MSAPWQHEGWTREQEHHDAARMLREVDAEAARDRAERADPDTARMVDNRDRDAAGGRFDDADSFQRLIDAQFRRNVERDREIDAQARHDGFPFWVDRDRPERGPTDRPGLIERTRRGGFDHRNIRLIEEQR